jgi:hypothetical protein
VDRTAASGDWGTVEWGVDQKGRLPSRDAFNALVDGDRAKLLTLFRRLASQGRIMNREQFKKLGDRAKGEASDYFEFKSYQHRFIGDFREPVVRVEHVLGGNSGPGQVNFSDYRAKVHGQILEGRKGRFVITAYTRKKGDNLSPSDIDRAVRLMHENDAWEQKRRTVATK